MRHRRQGSAQYRGGAACQARGEVGELGVFCGVVGEEEPASAGLDEGAVAGDGEHFAGDGVFLCRGAIIGSGDFGVVDGELGAADEGVGWGSGVGEASNLAAYAFGVPRPVDQVPVESRTQEAALREVLLLPRGGPGHDGRQVVPEGSPGAFR